MKATLSLKMGQSLSMTPQLQQAIKLLQLSSLDLQQEIQAMLDANPMLEIQNGDEASSFDNHDKSIAEQNLAQIELNDNYLNQNSSEDMIPKDLEVDTNWEDIYQTSASSLPKMHDDNDRDFSEINTKTQSLQEYLLWQLNLLQLTKTEHLIATSIIDSVNNQGYLVESIDNLTATFADSLQISQQDILCVLAKLQTLEPTGVCARDLRECLLLQLYQLPDDLPLLKPAITIVDNYLEVLASRNFKRITKLINISEDELSEAIKLIQSLNPRPGLTISDAKEEYIVPDLIVKKQAGKWYVELNYDSLPKIGINSYYANYIKHSMDKSDKDFMRDKLQDARSFIKSVSMRNETLLKVATQIVKHQSAFFEYGASAIKPMILQDIASLIDMHESTVSRVTTNKYMYTPQGVYELKFFFSNKVGDDNDSSSTAIKAMIKELIDAEDPKKPLSDSKLAELLEKKGMKLARRTVAKYRESLGIAATSLRKHLL